MTPAPVIWLITVLETPEEAAPMMAPTPWPRSAVVDCVAMSVLVSPESRWMTSTGLPMTPPASLISLMPRLTPAISGGPRKAREPVVGSSEPIFSGVSVVVEDAGTEPAALAVLLAAAAALGAGQEMPPAWPDADAEPEPLEDGVDEPPQAVARRATPMLSAVSLAMRGAAWGSEVIEKSPRSKGANGL